MNWLRRSARWIAVTLGVIVLTSMTVDATLAPNGFSQSALGILASKTVPRAQCPDGMTLISNAEKKLCVDIFEVSPGDRCDIKVVSSVFDTRANNEQQACQPMSQDNAHPWGYVTEQQSKELCARAGKRLPTNAEWYQFALGTPDPKTNSPCNIHGTDIVNTKSDGQCVNGYGIHDAIGNVWEWVDGSVQNGSFDGKQLPESGYVVSTDNNGVATLTHSDTPNQDFHNDYFWSDKIGEYGVLRGGYYASGEDGGLYSIQAKTAMSQASAAIGFRCVLTLN